MDAYFFKRMYEFSYFPVISSRKLILMRRVKNIPVPHRFLLVNRFQQSVLLAGVDPKMTFWVANDDDLVAETGLDIKIRIELEYDLPFWLRFTSTTSMKI